MLFRTILIACVLLLPTLLLAQKAEVRGVIVDAETKEPIVGASVTIVTPSTKAYIRGQQTTEKGSFHIEQLDPSTYTLQVTFLGYDELLREGIVLAEGQSLNLNQVELSKESELIEEVVVQGGSPDMHIGIDRKVFDVSQSLVSVGASASELLANVPTLEVDQDGSVSLRGSSNVRILIDGKESAMAGSDIASLLQSLPADIIDKVEIMTNPSAKFDAEGQSGIVNIILKKNARIGLNGTINASAGSFENAMAGATINYRNQTFNHFLSYNFNRRVNLGDGFNDNIIFTDSDQVEADARRIYADNDSRRRGHNHTMRLGTDYYVAENTTLSFASNVSLRDNSRRQDILYQYWNLPENGSSGDRSAQQYEDDFGLDLQFDFKQGLKREGEELTANVSFGYDTEDGSNDFLEYFSGSRPDVIRNNATTERGRNWNLQLDYVLPLGEDHKFEAGYRSIIRSSEDTQFSEVSRDGTGELRPDYFLSNNFDMTSEVHALYVNYQRMLTSKLGAQVGLRGEQMKLNSTYYNLDPDATLNEREVSGGYDIPRLYPSVFLSYEVGNSGDKVQLSYTRRVQRPRGWQVNPFISASDEQNLSQGNPNLRPEDIHSAELSFAKFYDNWDFISSVFYRRTNDMVSPIQFDPEEADLPVEFQNATYSIWSNVGHANDMGVELISKVNMTSWWDAMANVNIFNNRISPLADVPNLNQVNDINWNANLTTNLKFTPTLSLQARGHYRSPRKRPQGVMKQMWGADIAVKKDVLNNRASVLLNVRDVFNSRRFEMENYLPQRTVSMANRWNRRMFTLTFSYRFGVQDLFKRDEERSNGMSTDDIGEGQF